MTARLWRGRSFATTLLIIAIAGAGCGSDDSTTSDEGATSSQDDGGGYDYPFGDSTAGEYHAALYEGSLAEVAGGGRAIDKVVGGTAIDVTTPSLLVHDGPGDQGSFIGDDHRTGAIAKLLRWWDYYSPNGETIMTSVLMVDFDSREHALEAAEANFLELTEGRFVEEVDSGTEVRATILTDEEKTEFVYLIASDRPLLIGVSCSQYGTLVAMPSCDRADMRALLRAIIDRLPGGDVSTAKAVAGPANLPAGVSPLLQYEFDADQMSNSYLDLEGRLRDGWDGETPPGGRYPWTGRSYTFTVENPDPSGVPLQLIVDRVPIADADAALEFTSTICIDPSGRPSPYCGAETSHDGEGAFLGGRTAVSYADEDQNIVFDVRGHLATTEGFLDVRCGLPVLWTEEGLGDELVQLCETSIVAVARAFAES